MASKKIVMIGAASRFGPGLAENVIRNKELEGSHLLLIDLDADRAEILARYCRQRIKVGGLDYKVESAKADERCKALEGADFVVTALTAGGLEMLKLDIMMPTKYGVYYHAADSVGPGAVFKTLRLGPVFLEICSDMEKVCPNAYLVNVSNPMSAICTVVTHGTKIKIIGLCGDLSGRAGGVARLMGAETKDTRVYPAGINHFIWMVDARVRGEDGYSLLRERIAGGEVNKDDLSVQLFSTFGALPGGDAWQDYLPSTRVSVPEAVKNGTQELFPASVMSLKNKFWEEIAKQAESENPTFDNEILRGAVGYGSFPTSIMNAISLGKNELHLVNIPNEGAINNLPSNAVVEIPAVVGSFGAKGMCMGELPWGMAGLIFAHIAQQQLMAKAVLEKSKEIALQAFLADPVTKLTVADTIKLFSEMFDAQSRFLTRYK